MSARGPDLLIEAAQPADAAEVARFLQVAAYSHLHIDWRMPVDWLGTPGFVLARSHGVLVGTAAATVDPAPAAWLRVAAMRQVTEPQRLLARMLDPVVEQLLSLGATRLGVLAIQPWMQPWLPALGFGTAPLDWVATYVKLDLALPAAPQIAGATIRPVRRSDMAGLARLETTAFAEPLWRHSAQSLLAAWEQALSFDVLLLGEETVGFQYSTASQEGAHLVRLTIAPEQQGRGLGTLLLHHAIRGYHLRGLRIVSLNTQQSNRASQILYGKFGFNPVGQQLEVWVRPLV